jgi:peroxiredoxin
LENNIALINRQKKVYPEKIDSLNLVINRLNEDADEKNIAAAKKFASVQSGLERLYMVRLYIPKDTLKVIYSALSEKMKESVYGKCLLLHINTKQIEIGDKFYDFTAIDTLGNEFKLSSIKSDYILLIYEGFSCMGQSGRDYLNNIYENTERNKLSIVHYSAVTTLRELKNIKAKYKIKYLIVSDFLNDQSPVKINYGFQSRPTSILIDKHGTVILKSTGILEDELNKMKIEKKL